MVEGEIWLGVDFGTSNTVALIGLPGREPRPLLFDGSPLLPSAVCLDSTGRLLVGRDALHTAAAQPASLEMHPKRSIDDGAVLLGGHEVPVGEMIGAVLARVAEEAVRVGEGYPTGTVLTCPSAWRERRRETLLEAADRVLPGVRLMTEPVAAARYFVEVAGGRVPVGDCAVVYDFGAGTFDASVVRRTEDGFEVLASEGLYDSGGLDIDAAIVGYLGATIGVGNVEAWRRLLRPESTADRRASRQLWDNVRSAKEMLSRSTRTLVYVPSLDVEAPLGREQLDELARPVLDRTIVATRAAINGSDVPGGKVVAVFLTGGSSRLTAVPTVVHRAFGIVPTIVDQPELAVAEGAVRSPVLIAAAAPPDSPLPSTVEVATVTAPLPAPAPRVPLWRRPLLVGVAVAALLALVAGTALAIGPKLGGKGSGAGAGHSAALSALTSATPSVSAGASPSPLTGAACLIGVWRVVARQSTIKINGSKAQVVGGANEVDTFRADNTWVVDDKRTAPQTTTIDGVRWQLITRGYATGHYDVQGSTVHYATASTSGTWTWYRNGSRNNSGSLTIGFAPERFVCTGNHLQQYGPDYSVDLVRVG